MAKVKEFFSDYLHFFIVGFVAMLCASFLIVGEAGEDGYVTVGGKVTITEATTEFIAEAQRAIIDYAQNAIPTVIINGRGEKETIEAPTIESIDGGEILNLENCPKGQECGLGSFIYAPVSTFEEFKNYTIGQCWNIDGFAGSQCWDLASLHSMNYTKNNRVFSTCGTGAAKSMWDCKEENAGSEYDLVYNVYDTHVGDIAVFDGGTWGHTCFIAGPINNGYVACYGENQGGSVCPGGGAAANIVNLSISGFRGAFRPKTYVEPEPSPSPEPIQPVSNCTSWSVRQGDTMSGIMLACKGYVDWEDMNNYANHWTSQIFNPGKTVFWGWTHGAGYGLFANDVIKYAE